MYGKWCLPVQALSAWYSCRCWVLTEAYECHEYTGGTCYCQHYLFRVIMAMALDSLPLNICSTHRTYACLAHVLFCLPMYI